MPKPVSGKILQLEVRITPYDQKEIEIIEPELDVFTKFILCREGEPNGTPKLHYHGYIETTKSETWLRSYLRKLAHAPEQEKVNGNALFFTRKPHEHTMGYVIKSGNVICSHGVTQTTLDEWLESSKKYKTEKESSRKRKQRTREEQFANILKQLESDLHETASLRNVDSIIDRILSVCMSENLRFPTRSQMDLYVLKLMYKYDNYLVRSFYTKSFDR